MSHHTSPNPVPPWLPNTNSSSGQAPSALPGLNPQHLLSSQSSFEYNRTAIPGLSFAGSTQPWVKDATTPSSQPTVLELSSQVPNVGPKPNASLTSSLAPSLRTVPANLHAPIAMEDDTMEEGELSESAFEDLYEPYLEPGEENNGTGGPSQQQSTDDDEDYDPANPGSPMESRTAAATWSHQPLAAESSGEVRERSRSYSPYLSPHEVETQNSTTAHAAVNNTGSATRPQIPYIEDSQDAGTSSRTGGSDNLLDARKKARAAILRLWPLEVRYQHYVEEGIDEKVVHTLFAGLGLDTKPARANHPEEARVPPLEARTSTSEAAQPTSPTEAPGSTVTAAAEAPRPAPAVTSEERKDRIARRLMAAKAAKQASPGDNTQTPSTAVPASTSQQNATAEPKGPTDPSQKKVEKERLLQEKLAKLQQSRALRAQKASEKAPRAVPQESSSAHVQTRAEAILPLAAIHPSEEEAPASQEIESAEEAPLPTQPAPPIPGLFLSSSGSPLVNPRKRPVASDLNENSAAPPFKRTFNQHYVEKPLIIDISDGSDDEDIEMDMSSPVDGPASEHPPAIPAQPKSSSFRDHPPLTDKQLRRNLASPASRTSNGTGANDHDKAKLGHLTQNISELKQKIAELQRQKDAKTGSKESPTQSSNGTPAVETQQPPATDIMPTRSHSAGSSAARQDSPPPTEPDIQRTLPKVPRASSSRGFDRRQQIRVFSDKLPTLDASIATMVAKARVLESQRNRALKEADDLRSQRDHTHQELERLQAEENASPDPQQAQLPNGQQQLDEPAFSPSGDRDNLAAQIAPRTTSPGDNLALSREDGDTPPVSVSPRPETDDAEDRSEVPLPALDSNRSVASQVPEVTEAHLQPVAPPNEAGETSRPLKDTAMDESPLAEEPQQTSDVSSQSPTNDAMHTNSALDDGDETYNPPEPFTDHEADARELQAEILSPALADDSTPPILANSDSQESGTESAALPEHISQGVTDTAEDDLDLPPHVYDGRPAEAAINLTSYGQSKSAPETPSTTGFVPYESMLKGFLSYRFHPNFHDDVAGGLKSPTYSNKINPQVRFCLDFLLGICARGGSCKYQHIDAVGISESQTLLQLGNSERLEGKAYEAYVSGLRSLLAEFKAKQCKDFDAISQAIIDYRSRFYGDRSRVLPLGDVGL